MYRVDWFNKLRKKSASFSSFLSKCITMHGPESVIFFPQVLTFSTVSNIVLIVQMCRHLNPSLFIFFFFFHRHYSPLWALACRTMSFHFFLSATNSLNLLTPSIWRSLSTSSFHLFLGLPLLLVPSSSWVKMFLGILSSSILSTWPNQLILCPFIHFTLFSLNLALIRT